jgi:tripartite-type tricarboxylate transporter receptor subunit TctC
MRAINVRERLRALIIIVALCTIPTHTIAQPAYPNRPIKIIAPVAAGTVADLVPRIIAAKLQTRWGQPVIIENRPGGATNIGTATAARAEPDGYTLLASPATSLVVNQSLYKNLPFDPNAFVPVTVLAVQPNILVANRSVPAADLREFIAYAKGNPGKLTFASSGVGTVPHLGMELMQAKTGIRLVHVPYKGLAPALRDVLAERIDVMFDNLGTSAPHIKSGELKAYGIGTEQRSPLLPQVPPLSEQIPGLVSTAWFALVAPPKTPSNIIAILYDAVSETLKLPDVQKRFRDLYATPVGIPPAATEAFFEQERTHWRSIIATAGVKVE